MENRYKALLNNWLLSVEKSTPFGVFRKRLFADELAILMGVSLRTAQRWIREPDRIQPIVRELIEFKALGLIPDPAFEGFCVRDGKLFTPIGKELTPEMCEALELGFGQGRWLNRHLESLRSRIKELESDIEHWREKAGELPAANDPRNY